MSAPRTIFSDGYQESTRDRNYDIAPDGRFVFLKPASTEIPRLVYVQNWLAELEELVPPAM